MIERRSPLPGRALLRSLVLAAALAFAAAPDGAPASTARSSTALASAEEPAASGIIAAIGDVVVRTPSCGDRPCRRIYSAERVRAWLASLVGKPFDQERIVRRIERHYSYLGYDPRIDVELVEGRLLVSVTEARAGIAEVSADPNALGPSLPAAEKDLPPVDHPGVLLRAVRARPGDLVNRDRRNEDEYDLSLLGYDLVAAPSPYGTPETPRRYVVVRRIPRGMLRESEEKTAATPPRDPNTPRPATRAGDRTDDEESEDESEATSASAAPRIGPLLQNRLDGTADYSRRQLFTAQLTFRRISTFREFDVIEVSPYVARRPAGSIRYYTPYILPPSITRGNAFAQIRLYDDFTPDRLFTHTSGSGPTAIRTVFQADEERRGSEIDLGFEPLLHLHGHSLKAWIFVNRYRVTFSGCTIAFNCGPLAGTDPRIPGSRQNDIDILGASAEYGYEHLFRAPRYSWKLIPTAEVATRGLGGDVSFRRFSAEVDQHYAFPTGFEFDARWKAGIVDQRVPVFEEFSLGGDDSLRGFLRDDFIGRRFLAAQNDLWIPIPFRAFDRDSELMARLQRNLKVALTLDAGSVSYEDIREVHFARGVGIGIVYSAEKSPLVVRFDAAWGYWRGEKRFYPYISFTQKW